MIINDTKLENNGEIEKVIKDVREMIKDNEREVVIQDNREEETNNKDRILSDDEETIDLT